MIGEGSVTAIEKHENAIGTMGAYCKLCACAVTQGGAGAGAGVA